MHGSWPPTPFLSRDCDGAAGCPSYPTRIREATRTHECPISCSFGCLVGRTPWSAPDPLAGLDLAFFDLEPDAGVWRGPGGPPHPSGTIRSSEKRYDLARECAR